ncbi:E3 ubiquitin-protein transferase RMND5B-like isoform X1 [Daktulosphaira vitifoliae]|uniref:E3 ubiquitin-protein transferase RMND5B-like isoform X1 n=1 Tax=Daktulosphaira vitifoliae TaxID=58002 RepID=UPI0021AA1BDD|nr:E3 ubiquitin-protein transferase RMND5B-like isoform X1 [Daktulosphaira vitifoliae]XP_050530562.1 E3 ubiquitin-protein transferase RMND5B-like isoform X1 [Daktulosphaira vitifoliae]
MDACLAVDREVDKVLSKFGQIRQHVDKVLQQLIENLESVRNDLLSCNTDDELKSNQSKLVLLKGYIDKSKKETQKLATEHRELHSTVSKVGKAIDRNFISDFAATSREDVFSSQKKTDLVNHIISQHFYRQGMWDIADELSKEAGIKVECGQREPFAKLNHILESLKKKDIIPALEWAQENRSQLEMQMYPPYPLVRRVSSTSHLPIRIPYHAKRTKFNGGIMKPRPKTKKVKRIELARKILQQFYKSSSLEFKLHQLAFLTLVQKGVDYQTKAVAYARANFGQFIDKHEKDIQQMMGMLLFVPQGINQSPYSFMIQNNMWTEVNELFTRDACMLLGLSVESLLNVSINAGCMALPALLNIKQVMQQRQVTGIWSGKDELPIEIDLDSEHRYHSMFACPILRQQSSDNNPPMRLICGHVISKDALHKLGNSTKLKCPYCPMEQNPSEAKLICF